MPCKELHILSVKKIDIDQICRIHLERFKGSFMSSLGYDFLYNYYLQLINYDKSIALLCKDVELNKILGFCVGFGNSSLFYKFLFKKFYLFLLPLIFSFFKKPNLILVIFNSFFRLLNISKSKTKPLYSCVELSSIATMHNTRGIGSMLLTKFLEISKGYNFDGVILTTDSKNNEKALNFYYKNGFEKLSIENRNKREMYELIHLFHKN